MSSNAQAEVTILAQTILRANEYAMANRREDLLGLQAEAEEAAARLFRDYVGNRFMQTRINELNEAYDDLLEEIGAALVGAKTDFLRVFDDWSVHFPEFDEVIENA